jgi:hypothetical protein
MSEHIQPAPERPLGGLTPPAHREEHERTPGVAHESVAFDFRLIIWVGVGLAVVALVVQVALWFLLGGLQRFNSKPPARASELALDESEQPLGQRVDNVPGPHLEGIDYGSALLVLRTHDGEEKRFRTSADVRVQIGSEEKAKLFELREGQRVTIAYYLPGGVGGGLGIVTSVTSPPVRVELKQPEPELPEVTRTLNGEILKLEPRTVAAARDWAEVQAQSYGWIDRDKEIVHIPVEKAMEEVLRSKKFGRVDNKKKTAGDKR